jgi:hypothetical protein
LLFLSGVLLIIGPSKTYRFFFQKRKAKGTACFLGGIALVLYGWAMIGIVVEGWGFLNLFGDFFPTALCACRPAALWRAAVPPPSSACPCLAPLCVAVGTSALAIVLRAPVGSACA